VTPPRATEAGTVVAARRRHFAVRLDDGATLVCLLKGRRTVPACGDRVKVARSQGEGSIEAIEPRRNLVYRSDAFQEKLARVLRGLRIGPPLEAGVFMGPLVSRAAFDRVAAARGLAGDAILLEARIVAVADAAEAMLAQRPQRSPLSVAACVEELQSQAGRRYDARVVKACVKLLRERETRTEGEASVGQRIA